MDEHRTSHLAAIEEIGEGSSAARTPEPATPAETRAELARLAARGYVAIRHSFIQQAGKPSKLASFVTGRKHRALLLYLMILTCAPWLVKRDNPLPSQVWIRALDAPGTSGPTWSPSTLSRAFGDLEAMNLLEPASRKRRLRVVTPRREDGADAWTPANGKRAADLYFTIPDEFWLDELFAKLRLPGLAMFLIISKATSNRPEMYIPLNKAQSWFGISPRTVQNGIRELHELKLLHRRKEYEKNPLSRTGWTEQIWYSLTGMYSQEARAHKRKAAREAKQKRDLAATAASAEPAEGTHQKGGGR